MSKISLTEPHISQAEGQRGQAVLKRSRSESSEKKRSESRDNFPLDHHPRSRTKHKKRSFERVCEEEFQRLQSQYNRLLQQGRTGPNVILPAYPEIAIKAWQEKFLAEHFIPGFSMESPQEAEECHQMPPPLTVLTPRTGPTGLLAGLKLGAGAAAAATKIKSQSQIQDAAKTGSK